MKTALILTLAFAALFITACTTTTIDTTDTTTVAVPEPKVKVGVMVPLSGDVAPYGEGVMSGVRLAIEQLGSDVELIVEDSNCDAKGAVNAVNKLISVDQVDVIIGEVCSGATLAAVPIATENEVIMVSPTSSSPKLTDEPWVFRTIPSDAYQGRVAAQLMFEDGARDIAILYGNEDYSLGIKGVLEPAFEELGGNVVAAEVFERTSNDVRGQITKIKQTNPDAIYLTVNAPDSAGAVMKQLRELGMNQQVYVSEGLKSPAFIEAAGENSEGVIVTAVSAGTEMFTAAYRTKYNTEPAIFSSQGYDAMQAVHLALGTGARSGGDIKAALVDITFDGATGPIDFDANGDISGAYNIEVIQDGVFVAR